MEQHSNNEYTVDDPTTLIAHCDAATEVEVNKTLFALEGDNGRSEFRWLLLANGDLFLTLAPRGKLYEDIWGLLAARNSSLT